MENVKVRKSAGIRSPAVEAVGSAGMKLDLRTPESVGLEGRDMSS